MTAYVNTVAPLSTSDTLLVLCAYGNAPLEPLERRAIDLTLQGYSPRNIADMGVPDLEDSLTSAIVKITRSANGEL